ncbi:MAG: hypothetical protein A3G75_00830 [Verrucomicrobia bacterium RIFCSPLOWO2_12_FULL_64_8]|nr:MAG: hypothetical protein A3G75_00830 [Verrucomicrobia bacterium RIFCSPLOWO2_12_FULL_64_8]
MEAINSLTRDLATSVAFAVNDVRRQRGNGAFAAYAIINDSDGRPLDDNVDALRAYDIKTYLWSQRDQVPVEFGIN